MLTATLGPKEFTEAPKPTLQHLGGFWSSRDSHAEATQGNLGQNILTLDLQRHKASCPRRKASSS